MSAHSVFIEQFNRLTQELEFNPKWSNGVGFFDYAVHGEHAPSIPRGTAMKCVAPGGRRLIVIGTRLGNVVVFERATPSPTQPKPHIVYNAPSVIMNAGWIYEPTKPLDEFSVENLIGSIDHVNIGRQLEDLYSAMKKTEAAA
jgi:hypothetical protein